jgi:Immunity protein Imm1
MSHGDPSGDEADARLHNLLRSAMSAAALPHKIALLNGGSLAGQEMEVFIDSNKLCNNCEIVLPKVGLELGNPRVRFIDRNGRVLTMHDGNWLAQWEVGMRKRAHFGDFVGPGWPTPQELAPYFLAPPKYSEVWSDNDCWGLSAEGLEGTEHLLEGKGRIDVHLTLVGVRRLGVLLLYSKRGGGYQIGCYSKGDLERLQEWVRTHDGDLMPVGLFIPFGAAWKAVKEFIEKDGALPTGIEWISSADLPADAFPDPGRPWQFVFLLAHVTRII